jgi:large subunit ribosomal protein L18
MSKSTDKLVSSRKRARRVRYQIRFTGERPRLTVFRSNRHIYAQIVDDRKGVTLVQASTMDKEFRRKTTDRFTIETASEVGKRLAAKAKELNIIQVVFDRGPYLYHGKVRALADGARDGGLDF